MVPGSRHASGRNVAVEQIINRASHSCISYTEIQRIRSCPLLSSLSFKPSTILYCAEALNCNCLQIYTQIYRNIEKYSPYAIVILYALEPPETLLVKELLLALSMSYLFRGCHSMHWAWLQWSLTDIEWEIWWKHLEVEQAREMVYLTTLLVPFLLNDAHCFVFWNARWCPLLVL